jgi:hypothetical protein
MSKNIKKINKDSQKKKYITTQYQYYHKNCTIKTSRAFSHYVLQLNYHIL